MTVPVVILVRPQMGENIGAVARAMMNFGLKELRLVAPRDGWPNQRAFEVSSGADEILHAAKCFDNFPLATADVEFALATTARPRDMEKRVIDPHAAAQELKSRQHARCALVFGPERTGLENEEIAWCDALITIPTSPAHPSLNIAQSAIVVFYEYFCGEAKPSARELPEIAPKEDWQGLFSQLETYLDEVNYYRVADKKTVMWQNLRNMLLRGQWSPQEVRTLRGMLRAIWERRVKNK